MTSATLLSTRVVRLALLAALALGLLGAASAARPAPTEAAGESYAVRITFNTLQFLKADDGVADSTLEVYGSLAASASTGGGAVRNLGDWGGTGLPSCPSSVSWWDSRGTCLRSVGVGYNPYFFSETPLCHSDTYAYCIGQHVKGNNSIVIQNFKPGVTNLKVSVHLKDYDSGSADDDVCKASMTLPTFYTSDITSPKTFNMNSGWNGHGSCQVWFMVQKV